MDQSDSHCRYPPGKRQAGRLMGLSHSESFLVVLVIVQSNYHRHPVSFFSFCLPPPLLPYPSRPDMVLAMTKWSEPMSADPDPGPWQRQGLAGNERRRNQDTEPKSITNSVFLFLDLAEIKLFVSKKLGKKTGINILGSFGSLFQTDDAMIASAQQKHVVNRQRAKKDACLGWQTV